MKKHNYLLALKLAVSLAILLALYVLVDFSTLWPYLLNARTSMLAVVLLLIPISLGLRAYRFAYIINAKKKNLRFIDAFGITLVGEALNIMLPASAGDFAKAYYGYKKHNIKEEMISATLLDKISGVLGLFVLGAASAFFHGYNLLALGFCAAAVIIAVFTFVPRIIPWHWISYLQRLLKRSVLDEARLKDSFTGKRRVKLGAVAISIVGWMFSYAIIYAITQVFNLDINIFFLFSVAPLIALSRLIPLSWFGLGVQEGVTVYLFSLAGITPAVSIVVSLLFTVAVTVLPGLCGLFLILKLKRV